MNFETGEMVDVLPNKKKAYLTQYFSMVKHNTFNFSTNKSELDNVKFISIDMYENFRDHARIFFPKAKICADSFHVLKHLADDFRKVRIRCQNSTENPTLKYLLIKFRRAFDHKYQDILDNEPRYNKKLGRYINYRGIRDFLFENFPVLKVAFELKEYYIALNSQATLQTAPTRID